MQLITAKSKTNVDGILHLMVPTSLKNSEVEVMTILNPAENKMNENNGYDVWPPDFSEKTYGCMKDDPIQRYPQGDFPVREELL